MICSFFKISAVVIISATIFEVVSSRSLFDELFAENFDEYANSSPTDRNKVWTSGSVGSRWSPLFSVKGNDESDDKQISSKDSSSANSKGDESGGTRNTNDQVTDSGSSSGSKSDGQSQDSNKSHMNEDKTMTKTGGSIGGGSKTDSQSGSDMTEKSSMGDQSSGSDMTEKSSMGDQSSGSDMTEKSSMGDQSSGSDMTEKSSMGDQSSGSDMTEKSSMGDQSSGSDMTEKSSMGDQSSGSDSLKKSKKSEEMTGSSEKMQGGGEKPTLSAVMTPSNSASNAGSDWIKIESSSQQSKSELYNSQTSMASTSKIAAVQLSPTRSSFKQKIDRFFQKWNFLKTFQEGQSSYGSDMNEIIFE